MKQYITFHKDRRFDAPDPIPSASHLPDWFQAQVDRTSDPDLPAFDPGEALGGQSQARTRRSQRRSRSQSGDGDHPLSDVWD
jgi:hypothetical protein